MISQNDQTIPATNPDDSRLLAILDNYMSQMEKGELPDIEQLAAQHPDLAEPLREYAASLRFLHNVAFQLDDAKKPETPPSIVDNEKRLGDFKIRREIGRGGMGVVYEAHQNSLNRMVALKVLPFASVLDERHIARFHREAQAAGQLHHVHIVPVYSVGCEQGVHYYSMQLINGSSLDTVLEELRQQNHLDSESEDTTLAYDQPDRQTQPVESNRSTAVNYLSSTETFRSRSYVKNIAKLAVQAADGLQHAHDYGVVHRDIKPSNLMIDERGKLWITDFGLAHIQNNGDLTLSGGPLGTLRYMSPEQASGAVVVDQRTDVYSLGITVCELLSLRYAIPGDNREQIMRFIERNEPVSPRQLNPAIPIDLENILLKAISKNRDQRYQTAGEFRDDLQRFLDGRPTLAKRPSLLDRATKWAIRHKTLVAATFVVMFLTLVGTSLGTFLVYAEKEKTDAALSSAEIHFRQAQLAVDQLGIQMAGELSLFTGTEPLQQKLLTRALTYYQDFAQHAAGDQLLQKDLADTYYKIGQIHQKLGDQAEAERAYAMCIDLRNGLEIPTGDKAASVSQLALAYNNLAIVQSARGKTDKAETNYRAAIKQLRSISGDADANKELALVLSNYGGFLGETNRVTNAESILNEAVRIQRDLQKNAPNNVEHQKRLARSLQSLGYLQRNSKLAQATKNCREAIALQVQICQKQPRSTKCKGDLALSRNNLGGLLSRAGMHEEALPEYKEAVRLGVELKSQAPDVVWFRRELAVSYNNLARCYEQLQNLNAANQYFDSAKQHLIESVPSDSRDHTYFASLGGIYNNLAVVALKQGNQDGSLKQYEHAILNLSAAVRAAPAIAQYQQTLKKTKNNLAIALQGSQSN